jgi:hypothetical protein
LPWINDRILHGILRSKNPEAVYYSIFLHAVLLPPKYLPQDPISTSTAGRTLSAGLISILLAM